MNRPVVLATWSNRHPAAQEVLARIRAEGAREFYGAPACYGLLLAEDEQSYIMRVGALLGAGLISPQTAAALVRGLGVSILNPDEEESHGAL